MKRKIWLLVFTMVFLVNLALPALTAAQTPEQLFDEAMSAYRAGNYTLAYDFFIKAAEQGLADAQLHLGIMYADGKGVVQNYEQAVYWYRRATEQGSAGAPFILALMYVDGRGVEQSYEQAAHWFRRSAEQGHVRAHLNLGFMYATGRGVTQNYEQAVYWYHRYRRAAEQRFE